MNMSTNRTGLRAAGYVFVGALGIQASSAISSTMFSDLGSPAVSSIRLLIAAVVLLLVLRPRVRGISVRQWFNIAAFGAAMAAMNMLLYASIERLPLGIAVTLDFLGPAAVALVLSRRIREAIWALAALAGVVLIAGPGGYFDLSGFLFGLGAGFCFALYTVFAEKVGKADDDSIATLALSVAFAAVLSAPFGIPQITSVSAPQWSMLALSGLIGVALPYVVDTLAAKLSSARVIGTLFAIDPAVGSLVGWVALGEQLNALALTGIALIMVTGAVVAWTTASTSTRADTGSRRGSPRPSTADHASALDPGDPAPSTAGRV